VTRADLAAYMLSLINDLATIRRHAAIAQ